MVYLYRVMFVYFAHMFSCYSSVIDVHRVTFIKIIIASRHKITQFVDSETL